MSDLLLARLHKARALVRRLDKALQQATEGLIHGGRPRDRTPLDQLGLELRQYREGRGVSRVTLARETGLGRGTLKNMELGRHWPTEASVARLVEVGAITGQLADELRRKRPHR